MRGCIRYAILRAGKKMCIRDRYSHLQAVWNDVQETMSQGNVNATLSAN